MAKENKEVKNTTLGVTAPPAETRTRAQVEDKKNGVIASVSDVTHDLGIHYETSIEDSTAYSWGTNWWNKKKEPVQTAEEKAKAAKRAELVAKYLEKAKWEHCALFESYDAFKKAFDEKADTIKEDNYFPAKNGWMVAHLREINGNKIVAIDQSKVCPLLDEHKRTLEFEINNKIPKDLLVEIIGSFHRVCKKTHDEAAAQIYRKDDGTYFVYYPGQDVSGATVKYADDQGMLDNRAESTLVLELHSHNTMGAFWSGTDNKNEKEVGFYMVIGTLGSTNGNYLLRAKYNGIYVNFRACELFDMTEDEEREIFKAENFTEGNPIIDSCVRTYSASYRGSYYKSYGYNYGDYDAFYGGSYSAYRGLYGAKSNSNFKDKVKTLCEMVAKNPDKFKRSKTTEKFADIVTAVSDSYANSYLWKASAMDPGVGAYIAEGFVWIDSAWRAIDVLTASHEELVDRETKQYVKEMEELYSDAELQDDIQSGLGTRSASYMTGTNDLNEEPSFLGDVNRPFTVGSRYNNNSNTSLHNINEEAIRNAVAMQTSARLNATNNITNAVIKATGHSEGSTDTRILNKFKLSIFWEIITPFEKSLLADTIGVSLLELSTDMASAIAAGFELTADAALKIYEILLAPEDGRVAIRETLTNELPEYVTKSNNIVYAFNDWVKAQKEDNK